MQQDFLCRGWRGWCQTPRLGLMGQSADEYSFPPPFYYWNYNVITSIPPFLHQDPPIYSFVLSSKFMASFFINCYIHIHICIYTDIYVYTHACVFLNTTCSLCMMFLVCIFSEMSIWYWINQMFSLPRRNLCLSLSVFLS